MFKNYRDFRLWTDKCTNDTYSIRRDWQKLRHTRLAPGQFPWPNGTSLRPDASPGNIS